MMTPSSTPDPDLQYSQGLWLKRLESVSRAQARYLLLIALAGVFFFALDRTITAAPTAPLTAEVPGLRVQISSAILWAIGPTALMFFVLAVIGSVWALNKASRHVGAASDLSFEAADAYPNALDLAFYTVEGSPKLGRALGELVYPAYLWIFVFEAAWLWVRVARNTVDVPGDLFFLVLVFVPAVPAITRLFRFSWGRVGKARAVYKPPTNGRLEQWPEF